MLDGPPTLPAPWIAMRLFARSAPAPSVKRVAASIARTTPIAVGTLGLPLPPSAGEMQVVWRVLLKITSMSATQIPASSAAT